MSELNPRNRLTNRENNVGGLPYPAVSSPTFHPSQRRLKSPTSRWKFLLHYIKNGTGYATKQPEWSSSILDVRDHEKSTGSDPQPEHDTDDLGWISGQNGEDVLSLILVERDHSNASQTSPGLNTSQDNLNAAQDASHTNNIKISNDHTHRLKGYEPSIHEFQLGALTPFVWVRYRVLPWIRRAFLRYCYPEFNDPHVERIYSDRVYDSQKVSDATCAYGNHNVPPVSSLCLLNMARYQLGDRSYPAPKAQPNFRRHLRLLRCPSPHRSTANNDLL